MDKELFFEIVLFAEKAGFKKHLDMLPITTPHSDTRSLDSLCKIIFWSRRWEIIFDHEFAKAIWGVEDFIYKGVCECHCYSIYSFTWQHHLKKIVLQKDPFEYLDKEYKRIKK